VTTRDVDHPSDVTSLRVLVAVRDLRLRNELRALLTAAQRIVQEASPSPERLAQVVGAWRPGVVVLAAGERAERAATTARHLRASVPGLAVLVISPVVTPDIVRKLWASGVHGCVLASEVAGQLTRAIDWVAGGRPWFSARSVAALASTAEAEPDDGGALPASRRILVVDDGRDAADTLAHLLRGLGHQAFTAYDGLAAIEATATHRPDVVLLDLSLPKLDGFEAARVIRAQPWGRDIVLVAVTGWTREEDRRRALGHGFDHHLAKPVQRDDLVRVLEAKRPAP
jgi:CheY-like chemotaxis protein